MKRRTRAHDCEALPRAKDVLRGTLEHLGTTDGLRLSAKVVAMFDGGGPPGSEAEVPSRAYRVAEQRIWLQERLSATTCLDLPFTTTRPGARSSPSDSTRKKKHRSNNARLTPNVVCVSKEVTEARRWGPSSAVGLQVAHLPASLCQRNDASSGAQLHLPKEHAHRWLRGVLLGTVCFHRLFGHGAQDGGRHSHLLHKPFTERCQRPWPAVVVLCPSDLTSRLSKPNAATCFIIVAWSMCFVPRSLGFSEPFLRRVSEATASASTSV